MNKIINILKEKKSIPLDQFINISLYDKKFGYYMKKNPFGEHGDYITSPLISNLFGQGSDSKLWNLLAILITSLLSIGSLKLLTLSYSKES